MFDMYNMKPCRIFAFGFSVALLTLYSCASISVKYFGMAGVSYENGRLLGPQEADDLPFATCEPTQQTKNPCVVMLAKDFFALKMDYEEISQRLKTCEKK